jgi:hypothetical protein
MGRGTTDRETKLLLEELCPECRGEGCYYSPAWVGFNKAWDEAKKQADEESERISLDYPSAWARDRAERLLNERGISQPSGPEEPDCPTCEGSGRATRYVTILELADLIDAARAAGKK